MKKITSIALLLLPVATVFAQSGTYTLKGTVGSDNAPAKAYLLYTAAGINQTDSANIVNGSFEFKNTLTNPVKARLVLDHKGETLRKLRKADVTMLYLEPGTIEVHSADSVYNALVTGTPLNKENKVYQAVLKPFNDAQNKLSAEMAATPKDKRTPEAMAAFDKRSDDIDAQQKAAIGAYLKAHTSSLVSIDALKTYGGYYPDGIELEPIFNTFSTALKSSTTGKEYAATIAKLKLTSVGAQAPLFAQNDKDGIAVTLASFKGKYVLVDFWASWCGPCRRENPNVVKAYNQFKDKNFTILGVSLDQPTGREKWLKAIADDGLNWTQVTDLKFWKNEVSTLYGVQAIPQNFLIDPNGKIIAKNLFGQALVDKLTQVTTPSGGGKSTGTTESMNK